ncbi:permease-like cell division protein FtsX [Clostridium sp.]|uniref:permease-like cell division protein FtsX n=1 Tax=Clostridium sp. TaxID=1506 RepID=UPI00261DFFE9|nr:permease-like cell division protein FtsX [Clostridium sp.]
MKINTTKYFFVDAIKSLKRNRTLSVAAMITVFITFFIFGTFSLIGLNFNKAVENVASKVEVKVYLNQDIKLVDQKEIQIKLNEQDGVKEVVYESKDEAFLRFQESLKSNPGILEGYSLEKNPMQSSFIVKLGDPDKAEDIINSVSDMSGIDSVENQKDMIKKISSVVKVVRIIGIGLFIVFMAVSIFLITNTTKITVYSRRREIGIMKFVGATDWFIRWPFIIEGIIIGLLGAILSVILLFFAYKGVFDYLISSLFLVTLVPPTYILGSMAIGFLLGGSIIGAIGSISALRKFLDV